MTSKHLDALNRKVKIANLCRDTDLTYIAIAERMGCSRWYVSHVARNAGILRGKARAAGVGQ